MIDPCGTPQIILRKMVWTQKMCCSGTELHNFIIPRITQICHRVLPEQIIAARMRATVFTSMVRPFNWLLLVHSHIKVSPALLFGSCRHVWKRNMINHWLPKDNKLAVGQNPPMMHHPFIFCTCSIWNLPYCRSGRASAGEQWGHWEASCWDADSAAATHLDLFVTFELLHTFVSVNFSLRTPDLLSRNSLLVTKCWLSNHLS